MEATKGTHSIYLVLHGFTRVVRDGSCLVYLSQDLRVLRPWEASEAQRTGDRVVLVRDVSQRTTNRLQDPLMILYSLSY